MFDDNEMERACVTSYICGSVETRERILAAVSPEDFLDESLGHILATAAKAYEAEPEGDFHLVRLALRESGEYDAASFAKLISESCTWSLGPTYANRIRNLANRRRLSVKLEAAKSMCAGSTDEMELNALLTEIADESTRGLDSGHEDVAGAKDLVDGFLSEIERKKDSTEASKYATQFEHLNTLCNGGLRPGELTVVAARPSVGKSTFAINLLSNYINAGLRTLFVTLEMSVDQVMSRLFSIELAFPHADIEHSRLSDERRRLVGEYAESFRELPVCIHSDPGMSYQQLEGIAYNHEFDVVIVDYITLFETGNTKLQRYEQVGLITRSLVRIAMRKNIPVVGLAQLKREVEGQDRRPTLADLRESGNIEQDAAVVMMLHRKQADKHEINCPTELLIEKNRSGACGQVKLVHFKETALFTSEEEAAQHYKAEDLPNYNPGFDAWNNGEELDF